MKEVVIAISRVSGSEQEKSGYSLDAQARHARDYTKEIGLEVYKEYIFQESASKYNEQKKFTEILNEIKLITDLKNTKRVKVHLVVEKPDRLGRMHSRSEAIINLVKEKRVVLHYYREQKILDENVSPQEIFTEDIMTSLGKYAALNIGREAKKGMLQKAYEGWLPHKPPTGYKNNPNKKHPHSIIVNEIERNFILRIFELRGLYNLSYQGIVNKVKEEELVPLSRKKKFRKSNVEKWLKNPFYKGLFLWQGELHKGKHELIIPSSLHRKVEASFNTPSTSINKKHNGAFSDMLICGECGCKISYHPKRKANKVYPLYVCANGKKKHSSLRGMYKSEEALFENFEKDILDQINISNEVAEKIASELNANHKKLQARLKRDRAEFISRMKLLTEAEEDYYEDFKGGRVSEELFDKKRSDLKWERKKLEASVLEIHDSVTKEYMQSAESVLELAKNAKLLWLSRSKDERTEFMKKVLWNSSVSKVSIDFQTKKPFQTLIKMNEAEGFLKWGANHPYSRNLYRQPYLVNSIEYSVTPRYLDKEFLYQKYVVERLSCEEISKQLSTARTTILKYLKLHGIPVREVGVNTNRKRGIAYGAKRLNGEEAQHKRELENIRKMRELRDKGYSYRRIAEVFNLMGILTKTRRGKWHAKTVSQILASR